MNAYLCSQGPFPAAETVNVISVPSLLITYNTLLNNLMTIWPIDLHHPLVNNVCYLQAVQKLPYIIIAPLAQLPAQLLGKIKSLVNCF